MDGYLDEIRAEIEVVVKREIEKYMKQNKYEKPYDGVILEKNEDGTADVDIFIAKLFGVKNMTGQPLSKGDNVVVYARGGNINNSYIGIKF